MGNLHFTSTLLGCLAITETVEKIHAKSVAVSWLDDAMQYCILAKRKVYHSEASCPILHSISTRTRFYSSAVP